VDGRYNWARNGTGVGQREIAQLCAVDERTRQTEMESCAVVLACGQRQGARGRVTEYGSTF